MSTLGEDISKIATVGAKTLATEDTDTALNLRNSMLKNPKVLAEKILSDTATTCSLTIPERYWANQQDLTYRTITVPFYMSNDFTFALQNEWGSFWDDKGIGGALSKFLNFSTAANNEAQVVMQSSSAAIKTWSGSSFDGFNVECLFICTNRTINPVKIIQTLCTACLPARLMDYKKETGTTGPNAVQSMQNIMKGAAGGVGNFVNNILGAFNQNQFKTQVDNSVKTFQDGIESFGLIAPLSYGVNLQADDGNNGKVTSPLPGTTLSLSIGNWFKATELVVGSISNISFSKELIAPCTEDLISIKERSKDLYDFSPMGSLEYGFPLYAKCNISLKPYTLLDLKTFKSYFTSSYAGQFDSTKIGSSASSPLQLPGA